MLHLFCDSMFRSYALIAIPTYIIWVIVFFKSVHLDVEKAFEKYMIH